MNRSYRAAGISYVRYANICASLVRRALKEPMRSKAASFENAQISFVQWENGKQGNPELASLEKALGV